MLWNLQKPNRLLARFSDHREEIENPSLRDDAQAPGPIGFVRSAEKLDLPKRRKQLKGNRVGAEIQVFIGRAER